MRRRLLIYCEGQTEEFVVERVLRPHLELHGVRVERPILAANSLSPHAQRGGFVNWPAIRQDLLDEFAGDSDPDLRFTTLLDVYRMPDAVASLAGKSNPLTLVSDIDAVERAIESDLNESRFKAYLQRHEFEALLLADLDAVEYVFANHLVALQQLRSDLAGFTTAEEINHGLDTHPAARLSAAIPDYENLKACNAFFVLAQAGIEKVRATCPRFDEWLKHWENWGDSP